ncbi:cobalamin biosynthesis protein [Nocardia sp. ET3-3]|uniref:Cobalamin biosynthesis protein n=1 Tax=Nocardia terrae TaxID=2675851 RepID=A0A7K1UQR5_9NOCA|nr:cobalamin biosynthesis protein [Nocardia terrae]MVU76693.1 cobalamin biosynthesis protein [Nocardia terrae]
MPRPELAVGVGLRPGTSADDIVAAVREVVGGARIVRLATMERRASEPGFISAAEQLSAEIAAFSAEELEGATVPNPSGRVAAAIGTSSVAEAAAILASGGGELVVLKSIVSGIVVAAAAILMGEEF